MDPLHLSENKAGSAAGNSYGISNPVISKWKSSTWTTWDCIYFGSYWQNDTNGDGKVDQNDEKQPIKWRVLSVDGDDAFLMADQGLDCQPYNEEKKDVTWETCTLRTWLNGTFFNNAFSSEEQNAVTTTSVVNNGNADYGVEGGNTTEDKVFLLSIDEASNKAYGFSKAEQLWSNTAYVKALSAWCGTFINFWLRSPGMAKDCAATFNGGDDGSGVRSSGDTVYDDITVAVCPVLHLDLSSSLWSTAGKTLSYPPAVRTNIKWLGKGKVKVTWKKMAGVAFYGHAVLFFGGQGKELFLLTAHVLML